MDAVGPADVLAQQADGRLRDGQRIGGVDAQLRPGGGVRLFAGVEHVEHRGRDHVGTYDIRRRRVHHHRGMHAVKGAALQQQDLASALPTSSAGVPMT